MSDSNHKRGPIHIPSASPHGGGHEDGEGNWLVSYADMMTLLVGFFVILNSFSTVDQEKFESAKKAITKTFGGVYEVPYGDVSDRLKAAVDKMGLGDQFAVTTTPSGIEISFLGTVFFDMGSSNIRDVGEKLLEELIPIIKSENTDFDVTVEGHTDDVPVTAGALYRNNFELSSIRACRVLDSFTNSGFLKDRLTAVGYGETRPIAPNRDSNGVPIAQNMAQNRRVVIKLLARQTPIINVGPPAGSEAASIPQAPPAAPPVPAEAPIPAAPPIPAETPSLEP